MDASLVFHGFVRTPAGVYTTFEDPNAGMNHSSGYPGTVAYGINDAGAVVGMYTDANGVSHGFVRTPAGVFITIDAQGAGTALYLGTTAFSINDAGAIAGYYLDANKLYHGFFRTPAGAITTFDGPDASTTTWGTQALSIGNAGEIAGTYVGTDLSNHGFILAPK
jgi:probable HAF family extracellular repeat protein